MNMKYSKWIVVAAFAAPLAAAPAYSQGMNQDTQTQHQQHHQQQQQQTVQMKDLPSAVQQTVKRESAGKQVESIKKETTKGATTYRVKLESNGKSQGSIQVSQAGKVIKRDAAKQNTSATPDRPSNAPGQSSRNQSETGSY
jgi:uncharacterized membrane protein YkoI